MERSADPVIPVTSEQQATVAAMLRQPALSPRLRERLEMVKAAGLGWQWEAIAAWSGRSPRTVRHWLTRYGLKTTNGPGRRRTAASRDGKEAGLRLVTMVCDRHGDTEHVLDGRGYFRCKRCRADAVSRRRRRVKAILVQEAGGACCICVRGKHARPALPSCRAGRQEARNQCEGDCAFAGEASNRGA